MQGTFIYETKRIEREPLINNHFLSPGLIHDDKQIINHLEKQARTVQALEKYESGDGEGEGHLNLSGDLGLDLGPLDHVSEHSSVPEVDAALTQYIQRQAGGDRTDYICLICQKICKSRDECANHIEVECRES